VQRLSAESRHAKLTLSPRQEKLLNPLRDKKEMTLREIWAALGVSKQGALDLLRPPVAAALVKRTGTRKSGRYVLAQKNP
jgi:predicted HTH transcriptional regulator